MTACSSLAISSGSSVQDDSPSADMSATGKNSPFRFEVDMDRERCITGASDGGVGAARLPR
jgi:hypothetical protein